MPSNLDQKMSLESLSIEKLVRLLGTRHLVPTEYMRMDGGCIFIEVACLNSGTTALVYIPSRFRVPIDGAATVSQIEIVDPRTLGATDKGDLLSGRREKEKDVLEGIVKQLERIQHYTSSTKYDLLVSEGSYFAYIRDGECDCYRRKTAVRAPRSVRIVATLPVLFESSSFGADCALIYEGIQERVLGNLGRSTGLVDRLSQRLQGSIATGCTKILNQKTLGRMKLLKRYSSLLDSLNESMRSLETQKEVRSRGLEGDLETSRIYADAVRSIQMCLDLKKEVVEEIRGLRMDLDRMTFPAERIIHENASLLEKLNVNMAELVSLTPEVV